MKKFSIMFILALALGLSVSTAHADEGLDVLYKYDAIDEDGDLEDIDNYGYDEDVPLEYYPGSDETIMIPREYTQDKEQFKSSWVATIHNIHIDVPEDEKDFKRMYMERLDEFIDWNMNTMMFQIRPLLDAFYPSEMNPTSEFLSGTQGLDVDYDPLDWMIDVTHEAGLEYHAWLNPYRVTNSDSKTLIGMEVEESNKLTNEEYIALLAKEGVLSEDNFAVQNPEFVLRFDGKMILNPGYPETIDHVLETIDELIANYDLDAIHFDDYFYPYDTDVDMETFNKEDRDAFETYGLVEGKYEDTKEGLEQWRRDNVTGLVSDIHELMTDHNQENKTAVQLGISPFGIWEHKANDDRGSNTPTGSSSSYSNSIFADTRKWVVDEIVDYMLPQIYWEFDQPAAPYAELARWWDDVAEGKNVDLYVGHPNYKMVSNWGNSPSFFNREEINNQLYFNQQYDNIKGSALYGYRDIIKIDTDGMTGMPYIKNETQNKAIDTLKDDTFSVLPLPTEKPWLSHDNVGAVEDVSIDEENILTINDEVNDDARFYVVYKGDSDQSKDEIVNNPENIFEKIFVSDESVYTVDLGDVTEDEVYYVSVLDRASMETEAVEVKSTEIDDTDAANLVSDLLATLPTKGNVELKDKEAIEAGRSAYDALTAAQQDLVVDYAFDRLINAEAELEILEEADLTAANEVSDLLATLPTKGNVGLKDKEAIEAGRTAYDALTAAQQDLVVDYALVRLTNAEEELGKLDGQITKIKRAIYNLPKSSKLTLADRDKVEAAREMVTNLSDEDQEFVTTISQLEAREVKLEALESQITKIKRAIYNLPKSSKLTLADRDKVEAVREMVTNLSDEDQEFVTTISQLKAREAKLVELENQIKEINRTIYNLPKVSELTLDDKAKVEAVREMVDNLSDEDQEFVTSISQLEAREAKLEKLGKQQRPVYRLFKKLSMLVRRIIFRIR